MRDILNTVKLYRSLHFLFRVDPLADGLHLPGHCARCLGGTGQIPHTAAGTTEGARISSLERINNVHVAGPESPGTADRGCGGVRVR